jgi:hypothetical protein
MEKMQVDKLRSHLKQLDSSQIVYLKVSNWTNFPHIEWHDLSDDERKALEAHFRKCPLYADYLRGTRRLPPTVPSVGPYG